MPITPAAAFEKRHVTRTDGVDVLPRKIIPVAALEAGYCLPSPTINDAVKSAAYPDQMTAAEFAQLCEANQSALISAEEMAKAVVVVAPSNVITRGSLEEIMNKNSSKEDALSQDEVEALFTTLDTDNKGAITAEDFMRALYGEDGAFRLAERRKLDAADAERRKAEVAAQEQAKKEKEEEDRRNGEAAAAATAAATAAQAKEKEEAERKEKVERKEPEEAAPTDKAPAEKKKKASACC